MKTQDTLRDEFMEIYRNESDSIFRFCLARTSDHEVAVDLTQDVFFRFWKATLENQLIKNSRNFLFTIARNLIIDWYRKKKTLSLDALLEECGDDKTSIACTGADVIENEYDSRHLVASISGLSEPYRRAVYMRYVEGLKPREISHLIQESANVVSVRISRGTDKLRILLREPQHA